METWLEDSVAFPGRAFTDWIQLYRSDALARGELVLDGVPIDLGRVRCPIFNVIADTDYITPAASSLALETLTVDDFPEDRARAGRPHRPVDRPTCTRTAVARRVRLAARA